MRVAAADFSYKQQKEAPQGGAAKGGNNKDKKKVIKKTQKMNNKLADWDDDDPSAMQETSSRWEKVVILKHMFTLEELEVYIPLYQASLGFFDSCIILFPKNLCPSTEQSFL